MKKILFTTALAVFMFSCQDKHEGYIVSGSVNKANDGTKVYIEIQDEAGSIKAIDTAIVDKGKFEFKGNTDDINFAYIQVEEFPGKIPFIFENEKIDITIYRDSLHASIQGGSFNNDEFYKLNKTATKYQNKIRNYQQENQHKFLEAQQNQDSEAINGFMAELQKMQDELNKVFLAYPADNPNSFISIILLQQQLGNPEADFNKLKSSINALSPTLKNTKAGKELLERFNEMGATSVGQKAKDFSAPNPQGESVSLYQSLGKVTLVDFWASWCGPCRKVNPEIVKLYNEFHEKGFNIIGVGLEKDSEKWIEAIAADKLTWPHVSNLQHWNDPIAKMYNVTSIPATFLLDENGVIIAKNLTHHELKLKIQEILGS